MITPGVLATVAHVLYKAEGDSSSFQDSIRVIRDPEINSGHKMEEAKVIAVDVEYDIGLLRIDSPRSQASVVFTTATVLVGTEVGATGYPLMDPNQIMAQAAVPLLRFQGGHISAIYGVGSSVSARQLAYYETDMPMYKGSSGGPGFLVKGEVFGIHVAEWHDGGGKENPGQRAFSMWAPASAIISLSRGNKIRNSVVYPTCLNENPRFGPCLIIIAFSEADVFDSRIDHVVLRIRIKYVYQAFTGPRSIRHVRAHCQAHGSFLPISQAQH